MKLRKSDLIKAIETFRTAKLKELVTLKSDIARYEVEEGRWKNARFHFAKKNLPDNCKVNIEERWHSETVDITLSYCIDPKLIPTGLKDKPKCPRNIDSVEREINKADDQLALIRMCPEDFVTINSKIDREAIQPYISHTPAR